MIRSYRSAFILVFTTLMAIAVLSVTASAYRRASQISLNLSSDIMREMSNRIINRTQRIFEAASAILETDEVLFSSHGPSLTRDQVFRLFWRQLQLEPQLQSIYAADPSGNLLQVRDNPQLVTRFIDLSGARPEERLIYRNKDYEPIAHINGGGLYDPRDRSWYIGAMAAQGNIYWSPVYRFSSTGELGFTSAKAVYRDDKTLQTIVGVDIALDSLSEFLAEQRSTRGGIALIVDRHDNLVAFPYQLTLRERAPGEKTETLYKVDELTDTWIVDAYRAIEKQQQAEKDLPANQDATSGAGNKSGSYSVTRSQGVRYIALTHRFPATWSDGWKLLVVVPEASLLSAASRMLSESIIISVIVLISAVFLASVLAMRLFQPMRKLVQNTELVQQFRLDEVQPVCSRFREIQAMDRAICSMRQGLQSLSKFVPATVARELIQTGKEAKPGAEVAQVTLFFCAMGKFSSLCRTLPPERITEILAIILDRFTRIVLRNRGNIDNYLGESIMAFWGAPTATADAPARACQVALQCIRTEEELRRQNPEAFPAETRNLFAVHSGRAIVGNIGTDARMSYTAIGDSVEVGWRLKQLNRLYGTRIIVSDPVQAAVSSDFWLRRLDVIPLLDGDEQITVYELLGERSEPQTADVTSFVRRYEQGLAALRDGQWQKAQPLFDALAKEYPEDESVRLMKIRCEARDACLCPRSMGSALDVSDGLSEAL